MRTLILAALLGLGINLSVCGQSRPIKWGEVPIIDLLMTAYPADSSANVVILADYGELTFKSNGRARFKHHRRIKILSERGYDWGTVSIPYVATEKQQKISGLKAQTITLGANNQGVRHKLDKKDIFDVDLNGQQNEIRFTFPALEVGAVIEYQYTLESDPALLFLGWQFQSTEPTRWSEYRTELPSLLSFTTVTYGDVSYFIDERTPKKSKGVIKHRWVMKNVPALREEPFMTTPADYVAALELQLRSILGIDLLTTWDDVANALLLSGSFGNFMDPDSLIRARTEEIITDLFGPLRKMEAIYDFVRTNIAWDGIATATPTQELTKTLEERTGTSADLTLLLIAMLQAADITTNPVLLSTRDHGRVIESYPVMSQFNYVLAQATINDRPYLLDPTDPVRPHTLLAPRALNGRGLLLTEKSTGLRTAFGSQYKSREATWIDIAASGKFKRSIFLTATLDSTGTLSSQLQTSESEYSAFEHRLALQELDADTFVRSVVLHDLEPISLDTFSLAHTDDATHKLSVKATFTAHDYGQGAGNFMYLNPIVLDRYENNPLQAEKRTFPVDLNYPQDVSYVIRLTVPEGFTVEAMPDNLDITLPSGTGTFQRRTTYGDNVFLMQTRLILTTDWFPTDQYSELRSFFADIVSAQAEQLVLKRQTD